MSNKSAEPEFLEGDEVVLARGTYEGTLGLFVKFRHDTNWADIMERNGRMRSHPAEWLAHPTSSIPGFASGEIETWEGEGGAIAPPGGVTVAKEIDLRYPLENMGAQMVREVASKPPKPC